MQIFYDSGLREHFKKYFNYFLISDNDSLVKLLQDQKCSKIHSICCKTLLLVIPRGLVFWLCVCMCVFPLVLCVSSVWGHEKPLIFS